MTWGWGLVTCPHRPSGKPRQMTPKASSWDLLSSEKRASGTLRDIQGSQVWRLSLGWSLGLQSGRQVREHFGAGGHCAVSTASNGVDAGSGLLWEGPAGLPGPQRQVASGRLAITSAAAPACGRTRPDTGRQSRGSTHFFFCLALSFKLHLVLLGLSNDRGLLKFPQTGKIGEKMTWKEKSEHIWFTRLKLTGTN